MTCKDFELIVFGAILGFGLSILSEFIRKAVDSRDRRKHGEQLFKAIILEIEGGINRCQTLVQGLDKNIISFSRIYTALWDSMIVEISYYILEYIKDPEILKTIHSIYNSFDLINFNMEREEFGVGAAFAKSHLEGILDRLSNLKGHENEN